MTLKKSRVTVRLRKGPEGKGRKDNVSARVSVRVPDLLVLRQTSGSVYSSPGPRVNPVVLVVLGTSDNYTSVTRVPERSVVEDI